MEIDPARVTFFVPFNPTMGVGQLGVLASGSGREDYIGSPQHWFKESEGKKIKEQLDKSGIPLSGAYTNLANISFMGPIKGGSDKNYAGKVYVATDHVAAVEPGYVESGPDRRSIFTKFFDLLSPSARIVFTPGDRIEVGGPRQLVNFLVNRRQAASMPKASPS